MCQLLHGSLGAAGLPVVTNKGVKRGQWTWSARMVVPSRERKAIAEAITTWLENQNLRAVLDRPGQS
jgi:hypothetical protein